MSTVVTQFCQKNPTHVRGGIEHVVLEIDRALKKLEGQSIVSRITCLGKNKKFFACGTDIIELNRSFSISHADFPLRDFFRFVRIFRDTDIAIIHHPFPFITLVHALFPALKSKRVIIFYHADIIRQKLTRNLLKIFLMRSLNLSVSIFSTTKRYALYSPTLVNHQDKIRILHIPADESKNIENSYQFSKRYEQIGTGYFLYIGANRSYKGIHLLLEAFRELPFILVCVGFKFPKEEIPSNVYIIEGVDQMEKMTIINGCRALVLASNSRAEAYGICLVEALSQGKPIICSDIESGCREINIDGETGFFFRNNSVSSLKEAVYRMDGLDVSEYSQMSLKAKLRYTEAYSRSRFDGLLEKYMVEVLGK